MRYACLYALCAALPARLLPLEQLLLQSTTTTTAAGVPAAQAHLTAYSRRKPILCGTGTLSSAHLKCQPPAQSFACSSSPPRRFRHPQAFKSHTHALSTRHTSKCRMCTLKCQAKQHSADMQTAPEVSPEVGKGKKLLIIGGTGRVGSSTADSLRQTHPNLTIILASQSQESYDAAVKNRPSLQGLAFTKVNRNDLQSIMSAVKDCDLVLHCAGPFQRKNECLVLEAAIQAKKPYIGELACTTTTPACQAGVMNPCLQPQTCLPFHKVPAGAHTGRTSIGAASQS